MAGEKSSQKASESKQFRMPIAWDIPQDMVIPSATHIIVQRDGPDFIVNFFEVRPPVVFGTEEEKLEQLQKMDAVHAKCVSRLLIAAERMPGFVKAFSEALQLPSGPAILIEEGEHDSD